MASFMKKIEFDATFGDKRKHIEITCRLVLREFVTLKLINTTTDKWFIKTGNGNPT